jgi:hypothetical protein
MMRSYPLVAPRVQPSFRPFSSGRYVRTNPPRRVFGLKLLGEHLPDTLRTALLRAWLHPRHFDGNQAIQSLEREHPDAGLLFHLSLMKLRVILKIELEAARRMVEIPGTEITREARATLLRKQGIYLQQVYAALAAQGGAAAAQDEFERLLLAA